MDVRDIAAGELRRHVVTVTQEPFLFSDTLRANVAFGVEEETDGDGRPAETREEGAGGPRGEGRPVPRAQGRETGAGGWPAPGR